MVSRPRFHETRLREKNQADKKMDEEGVSKKRFDNVGKLGSMGDKERLGIDIQDPDELT